MDTDIVIVALPRKWQVQDFAQLTSQNKILKNVCKSERHKEAKLCRLLMASSQELGSRRGRGAVELQRCAQESVPPEQVWQAKSKTSKSLLPRDMVVCPVSAFLEEGSVGHSMASPKVTLASPSFP